MSVARQALQKRRFPPSVGGLFRVAEVKTLLRDAKTGKIARNIEAARSWFDASEGARVVNAHIALGDVEDHIWNADREGG